MKPDVLIVGGGVIGCSIALKLANAGLRVTLVERATLGAEASRAAAGMLSPQAEAREPGAFFNLCLQSKALYRNFVDELESRIGINVGYRNEGTLMVSLPGDSENVAAWADWQIAAGMRLAKTSVDDLRQLEPAVTEAATGAVSIPDDHQVDNRLLMDALAIAVRQAGVDVIEGREVRQLLVANNRITGIALTNEQINAGMVIVAAGSWSGNLLEPLGVRCTTIPALGQMLAVRSSAFRYVLHSERVYLVPRQDNRILIGATVEYTGFEKRLTVRGIHTLLAAAIELVPELADSEIIESWAGLRPDSVDHLPILGASGIDGLLLATGHFRNGILLAPVTADLMAQLVLTGVPSEAMQPFSLARFGLEKDNALQGKAIGLLPKPNHQRLWAD